VPDSILRGALGFVQQKYQDGRQSLASAVQRIKLDLTQQAGALAGQGLTKLQSTKWVSSMLTRFKVDPQAFNAMATDAVQRAVSAALDKVENQALNSKAGRELALINAGIQGGITAAATDLNCDGSNGCQPGSASDPAPPASGSDDGATSGTGSNGYVVANMRVLQNSAGSGITLYFTAEYSPDAIGAAAGINSPLADTAAVTSLINSALSNPTVVQQSLQAAAKASPDAAVRASLSTCAVTGLAVAPPVVTQTPISDFSAFMAPAPLSTGSSGSPPFTECSSNCPPAGLAPKCGFFQVRPSSLPSFSPFFSPSPARALISPPLPPSLPLF
jgi:hypothetical protein